MHLQVSHITDGIIYHIPPGNPDPLQKYSFEDKDRRKRIFRPGYNGGNPWHHALTLLQPSVGKYPPPELLEIKKIEKIFNRCIQKIEEAYKIDFTPQLISNPPKDTPYHFIDKRAAKMFLDKNNNEMAKLLYHIDEQRVMERKLEAFIEQTQYDTLGDYLDAEKSISDVRICKETAVFEVINNSMTELLKKFNMDPATLYAQDKSLDPEKCACYKETWQEFSVTDKLTFLQSYLRRLSINKFNLKVSAWKPADTIQILVEELKAHGPLCVAASIGQNAYKVPPKQSKRIIENRKIYYWEKGAARYPTKKFNAVLIIGAENTGHVYFIDPKDASDPKDIEAQRIYVISYGNLISHIADVESFPRKKAPDGIGYAVYA